MGLIKFILHIIGWLFTIILQIELSFLIIFLFSLFFADVGSTSRMGWLGLLFVIWLAYVVGINLVGSVALRWVWKGIQHLATLRLIGTAVGALIPLLILLVIGYRVPVGNEGTRFYDLVTNNWQPVLTQTSLFAAIVGYYVPGLLRGKR
jgi:hypothetical protein